MKVFKFKKIDAFAVENSSGNPAGAIYLNSLEDITISEMQRIAKELKGFVNEVGYLCQLDKDFFNLKYYSSEREVDFCGHATIAIMYDLIKNRDDLFLKDVIYINTSKGKLSVLNRIDSEDAVFISAPKPIFTDKIIPTLEIAKALHIDCKIINENNPISIVNAGLETLILPIKGLDDLLSIAPDLETLKEFCMNHSIDIIEVYTEETSNEKSSFRTRVFAPTFGYLEDPATGSGNAAFGYYLYKKMNYKGATITIEQNSFLHNANIVKLEFTKDKNNEIHVLFGGSGIVRINGEYYLK
ncbi:phenazine biosynthesis protein PhzF family [Anaerovirgula multivorans]|uniref:Phenazine biosynthesis protein PhzF family n=1 Tax=Anaerovirgula multivorans TaxID=312168 RepID=A0A239JCG3_9FIRM|nr:PhzF family phenazine biosynthesis protein [Anaerovirgula multivorans]SNT03527.1 phenazine biosynthesis protein PhzF family [Anaerovirgula multivorans]